MQKLALVLIALAVALAGFAAGVYYESGRVAIEQEEVWETPTYPARDAYATPTAPRPGGAGAEQAGAALREALAAKSPFERIERLAAVLEKLGSDDVPAIRALLEDLRVDLGAAEIDLLVRFWAAHDSEAALRWAARESPTGYRVPALVAAMYEQALRDPRVALVVFDEMNKVPNQNAPAAQVALVRGWYDSGEPGLEEYIRHLGIGFERQRVMGIFARTAIARDGPDPIMEWAWSLPDEDHKFKITVFRQVGSELAKLYPEAAVAWCERVCEGEFGSSVRTLIAQRWAAQDGYATMKWLEQAPPGQERKWAVQGAYRGWRRARPEEFDAWFEKTTQDGTAVPEWLVPISAMYPIHIAQEPGRLEYALGWLPHIPDENLRKRAYISIGRIWFRRDPEAAEAWLQTTPLDESDREAARALGTKNPYAESRSEGAESDTDPGLEAGDLDEGA